MMRDVTNAGIALGDRIGREAASHTDLEEALEASRYVSHPYATHPREVRALPTVSKFFGVGKRSRGLLELVRGKLSGGRAALAKVRADFGRGPGAVIRS